MALPNKAEYEKKLDTLAAQVISVRAGYADAALTPHNGTMMAQVSAMRNSAVRVDLTLPAHQHDQKLRDQSVIDNQLAQFFGPYLAMLQSEVRADGRYASLDAALSALGVQVSPVLQSIAPTFNALGGAFSPHNVWCPAIATSEPDVIFDGVDADLKDVTGQATFTALSAPDHVFYLGFAERFPPAREYLSLSLATPASEDVGLRISFWDGDDWFPCVAPEKVSPFDNIDTAGLTQSGVVTFSNIVGWEPVALGDQTPRYYLRFERTTKTLKTAPVINGIRRGRGMGLVLIGSDSSTQFVPGTPAIAEMFDAPNKLKLRALYSIGHHVTPTIHYMRRDKELGRSKTQGTWSGASVGKQFPAGTNTYLSLQEALEGVRAITGVTVETTATRGAFVIESVPERTEIK